MHLALLCTFKRMRDILDVKEEMRRPDVPFTMVEMVRADSLWPLITLLLSQIRILPLGLITCGISSDGRPYVLMLRRSPTPCRALRR